MDLLLQPLRLRYISGTLQVAHLFPRLNVTLVLQAAGKMVAHGRRENEEEKPERRFTRINMSARTSDV